MYLVTSPLPSSHHNATPWGWDLACLPCPRPPRNRASPASTSLPYLRLLQPPPCAQSFRPTAIPPTSTNALTFQIPPHTFTGPPPSQQASLSRNLLHGKVQEIINAAWEPSTKTTYARVLSVWVHGVEHQLEAPLLPLNDPVKIMTLFAAMDGMAWSRIQANRSAVRAWHICHNAIELLDAAWTPQVLQFWAGLKKRADHSTSTKRGLTLDEMQHFVAYRIRSHTPAGLRDTAMALFCFFGVRRVSEALQLTRGDVFHSPNCVKIWIRRQKNDTEGKGQWCFIPFSSSPSDWCPATHFLAWCTYLLDKCGDAPSNPLFCVTTTAFPTKATSADNWRKALNSYFKETNISSHSLRRGGAQWWVHTAQVDEETIRIQGGWRTSQTMKEFYVQCPPEKVADTLASAWVQRQEQGQPLHVSPSPERPSPDLESAPSANSPLPVGKRRRLTPR